MSMGKVAPHRELTGGITRGALWAQAERHRPRIGRDQRISEPEDPHEQLHLPVLISSSVNSKVRGSGQGTS